MKASPDQADPRHAATAGGRRARLEAAWAPLLRAVDAATLYDPDHPAVRERLTEAAAAFAAAFEVLPCTLLVEPNAILPVADPADGSAGVAEARLAGILHERDAAAIRFTAAPGAEDVRALAEGVAAWRPGRGWDGSLGRVEAASDGRVSVEPLDFARLTAGAGRGTDGPADWSNLLACLVGGSPDGGDGPTSPHHPGGGGGADEGAGGAEPGASAGVRGAAEAIAHRLRADPQVGAELLRRRLAQAGATLSGGNPAADAATRARIRSFATELGRLLAPAPEAPGDGPSAPPVLRQSLLMCHALSGFDAEGDAAPDDGGAWMEDLCDLFKRQEDPEHTPPAYMRRLEALAARQDAELRLQRPRDAAVAVGVIDPAAFRSERIQKHALGMAVSLLEEAVEARAAVSGGAAATTSAAEEAEEAALGGHAADLLPALVRERNAAELLRLLSLSERTGGPVLRAAVDTRLRTAEAGGTLAGWVREAADAETVLRLVRAAGAPALEAFVLAVAADRKPVNGRSPLAMLSREELGTLRGAWLSDHPKDACRLARLLAPLAFPEARELLGAELVQSDPTRRLQGFVTLLRVTPGIDPGFLIGLLGHPDAEVLHLGLDALLAGGAGGGERSAALLHWLRRKGVHRQPGYAVVLRGLAADESGRGLLHELLRPAAEKQRGRHSPATSAARVLLRGPSLPPALHAAASAVATGGADGGLAGSLRRLIKSRFRRDGGIETRRAA